MSESFEDFVESSARMAAIHTDLAQGECPCTRTEVRMRSIRGGSSQWIRQCLDCGQPVGNPVKAVPDCTAFDNDLVESYLEEHAQERRLSAEAERKRWWTLYQEYIESDAWKALRARVLKRDGGMCQGCLDARATEVHHMSYRNFGAEFAFELVALCSSCHQRIHQRPEESGNGAA